MPKRSFKGVASRIVTYRQQKAHSRTMGYFSKPEHIRSLVAECDELIGEGDQEKAYHLIDGLAEGAWSAFLDGKERHPENLQMLMACMEHSPHNSGVRIQEIVSELMSSDNNTSQGRISEAVQSMSPNARLVFLERAVSAHVTGTNTRFVEALLLAGGHESRHVQTFLYEAALIRNRRMMAVLCRSGGANLDKAIEQADLAGDSAALKTLMDFRASQAPKSAPMARRSGTL